MMAQIAPKPEPPEAVEPEKDRLRVDDAVGKDVVVHRVRPGETLSGIAMAYYDTYLTDVYYHVPFQQFMTADVTRPYKKAVIREMGKVADVVARLNGLRTSRLKVGSELVLPRILGLPFQKPEEAAEKSAPPKPAKPASPPSEEKKRAASEAAFQDLLAQGRRYLDQGAYAAAIRPLALAHGLKPDDPDVREHLSQSYAALGEAAFRKKDYLRAANAFESALRYNPSCEACRQKKATSETRYMDLHYKKGIQFFEDEQLVKAIEEWERVQQLDPDYQNVQKNIELARRLLKRLGEMEKGKTE
jgi:Tfp pilus assembly protein PilF